MFWLRNNFSTIPSIESWPFCSLNQRIRSLVLDAYLISERSGPEVIKLFSCPNRLRMRFQLLIQTKMLNKDLSSFQTLRCCIYSANNVKMPTIVSILTLMSMIFYAQLRWAWKRLYNLGPGLDDPAQTRILGGVISESVLNGNFINSKDSP